MNTSSTTDLRKTFTQDDIESLLSKLGIGFTVTGKLAGNLEFASLRALQSGGIYYIASGITEPESVTNSLILTDRLPASHKPNNVYIVLATPQIAFYKLMRACYPNHRDSGIDATALINPAANIAVNVYIGPYCVIEGGVSINRDCQLDSHTVVKSGSFIGEGTHIESHGTIGATGVAWVWDKGGNERIIQPQIGGVRIGKKVFIGSDVSIVRGSVNEMTEIGDGTVIAPGSKIGHGCCLGENSHLANNVALGGNVTAGCKVFIGSGAVIRPHVRLADGVVVGAGAVVIHDVNEPETVVGGVPAKSLGRKKKHLTGVPAPPTE